MKEDKVIDWIIHMAKNVAKSRKLNSHLLLIFNARLKTLTEVKAKLKRIDSFGGVESLISKASITGQKESLFPID